MAAEDALTQAQKAREELLMEVKALLGPIASALACSTVPSLLQAASHGCPQSAARLKEGLS